MRLIKFKLKYTGTQRMFVWRIDRSLSGRLRLRIERYLDIRITRAINPVWWATFSKGRTRMLEGIG